MADSELLTKESSSSGRIVLLEAKNGVQPLLEVHKVDAMSAHASAHQEAHIEAPCCRDIHGNEPPDGGTRAWLVMVSAFLCNGVIFGIINTYGVIHSLLTDRLLEQGDKEASSKAAFVGSLTIGTTFLLSPIAGVLTDKIGLRLTTFIGGVLSAGGLLISSFCTNNITALYLTYGVMFGFGAALAYTPTLAILGHYFKRYLGKVSGFVTAGSSVFTVILPPALDYLVKGYGLETTLQAMSFIACFIIVCSFVYKPLHLPPAPLKKEGRSRVNQMLRSIINVDIWKRKKYVIWALCVPLALFGYFVPYVHMMKFVETVFPGKNVNLPVMCIGITSGFGRLIFGAIADLPGVNRIYLQQLSLFCIGVVTLLLPLTSSYVLLIVFALVMGLFDGCFISLLGPIAYQICGPSGATQAIGFLLGLSSIPLTVGPPIAGMIFDSTGTYTTSLVLAGIPPIVGALVMLTIRCIREQDYTEADRDTTRKLPEANGIGDVEKSEPLTANSWQQDEPKSTAPLINGHARTQVVNAPATEAPLRSESNGKAHLADTGIHTQSRASWANFTLNSRLKLFATACACASPSCSALTTNHECICPKTALLSVGCMSTLAADDASVLESPTLAKPQSRLQKRRYTYSIY